MLNHETDHSRGADHPNPATSHANEITLQNTAQGISATFDGPGAAEIFRLFGANVLPVNPAPCGDTMQDVARMIRKNWPGWAVGVV